jgi:phage shock protein A
VLVAGGATWPWQNPLPALNRVLAQLDARGQGQVDWFGGVPKGQDAPWTLPEHPRLNAKGWVPREKLLHAYAGATAAIDWMEPNPERALAFSFRHADYLGCGVPILTHPGSALSDVLGKAGWISSAIEETVDAVLDQPEEVKQRGKAARALAKIRFSSAAAIEPLVRWVEDGTRARRQPTDLLEHARLAARAAESAAAQHAAIEAKHRAEAEVTAKRAEVSGMVDQVQSLTRTVDRLSRAVDEVAGFKREAIAVLGNQSATAAQSVEDALRENALLRADVEKKTAELQAMDELRQRLENDIENLRKEIKQMRNRGLFNR